MNRNALRREVSRFPKDSGQLEKPIRNSNPGSGDGLNLDLASGAEFSLCEARTLIEKLQLSEPQANAFLKSIGYPPIAGYLTLTHIANVDVDFNQDHDIRRLLIDWIHSAVLERPITEVSPTVSVERPQFLDDERFGIFLNLLTDKILRPVRERNYQSIATVMGNDIVDSYPIFVHQTKMLLMAFIREASELGALKYLQGLIKTQDGDQADREELDFQGDQDKEQIDSKVNEFLADLNSNKHVINPTKYEILLKLFMSQNYEPMDLEELGFALYSDADDPNKAIQYKISQLNSKLLSYKIQVERSSKYILRRVEDDNSKTRIKK